MDVSQKHFRKREAILSCLQSTRAHPTAEALYAQLKPEIPDLSLATVYRNLNLFKKQGLAVCVANVDGTERFDADTHPHVHFICQDCGSVVDLDEMAIPDTLRTAAESCSGGTVIDCQLNFTGRCRNCL